MKSAPTETLVPVPNSAELLRLFVAHVEKEHDLQVNRAGDGARFIEQDGFRVDFKAESRGLVIRIDAPSPEVLVLLKEEVAHHIGDFDARAAQNIRWSGENCQAGGLPANFKALEVVSSIEIFSGMQRVTLTHEDAGSLAEGGIHVRLMLPREAGRTPVWPRMAPNGTPIWPKGEDELHVRYMTIKSIDTAKRQIEIDIVRHGGGPVSDWSLQVKPGEIVGVLGPSGGRQIPEDAKRVFIAADGTAMPAVARMLASLPAEAEGDAIMAAPEDCDFETYFPKTALRFDRIAPERFPEEIAARALETTRPGETDFAFFAGEVENAKTLRAHFKDALKLDKKRAGSAGYWRREASEAETE